LGFAEFERALAQARQEQAGNPAAQRILDQLESWTEETGLARLWRDRLGREIRS
jgi:hypothetical protein